MVDMYVFKKPTPEYLVHMNPKKEYARQAITFISKMKGIDRATAAMKLKEALKNYDLKDPIVRFNHRNEKGDVSVDETTLLDYIQSAQDNKEVIVPSFTTYVHPTIKKSLHAEFINVNIKARKEDKKLMFYYTQTGDAEKAAYYDNMQATRKIFNNSLSGAYASKSTILYNPSAHYTLTSTTRCVASIGNAVTESIVSGNKIFNTPEAVINYITAVLTNTDFVELERVFNKYNIQTPDVDGVMQMVVRSTEYFWNIPDKLEYIRSYLEKLTPLELGAVMYTNDLYHFRQYNPELTIKFLEEISLTRKGYTTPETELNDINNVQEGIQSHIHNICSDLIKGMAVDYEKMVGTETMDVLASSAKYIAETLTSYKDLIRILFVTDTAPVNIAYIKELMRRCIVLSDTDSTCATYDEWVDWYYTKSNTVTNPIAIASSVMTIATQVMDHYIKILSGSMNIDVSRFESLKNEFMWNTFVTMNASKHYFADVAVKEGNVFEKPKLELKGVHLIASNVSQHYRDIGHGMINDIRATLREGKKLDIFGYVKLVADTEREIISRVKAADTSVLSIDKIKDQKAYKDSDKPELTPFFHHLLWGEVFEPKYGPAPDPTYMIVKVPTTLDTPARMKEYIDNLQDKELADRLRKAMVKYNKKYIGTFRPPLTLIEGRGLPDEIFGCVDYKRIVKDNCGMMYAVLEAIGFYKHSDMLISELGPY